MQSGEAKVLWIGLNRDSQPATARVSYAGRMFEWSARAGVHQFIHHPVSNCMGYGDGYWRSAGRKDAEAVALAVKSEIDARLKKGAPCITP